MKTVAICCKGRQDRARFVAGVEPITAPPLTLRTFKPDLIDGATLLYVRLHALPHQPIWYGARMVPALSAARIRQCDLTNAVVFAAVNHLPRSASLKALFEAGAEAVVGGAGREYARHNSKGADIFFLLVRRFMGAGFSPSAAFGLSNAHISQGRIDRIARDAINLRFYTRKDFQ